MNLCVIPARGGSKRIPRKNIRPFAGKPMVAYAIQVAQDSRLFGRIIVSTDDQEVAKVSQDYGAEVPFKRPADLADDNTPTVPVIAHAIKNLQQKGNQFEFVCCIYPCVPLLGVASLKEALFLLKKEKAEYCVPIAPYRPPIQRSVKINSKGRLVPLNENYELSRTQDLDICYHDVGQFYWGTSQAWLSRDRIYSHAAGFVMPDSKVIDIDRPEDWQTAEAMFHAYHKEE
jgi:pseudaminic acid cytidylyltransferase